MNVAICDICGGIVEQIIKKPKKGVCICGKCLGTLAAIVMERNQQESHKEILDNCENDNSQCEKQESGIKNIIDSMNQKNRKGNLNQKKVIPEPSDVISGREREKIFFGEDEPNAEGKNSISQDAEKRQAGSEDVEDDFEYTCMDEALDLGWRPGLSRRAEELIIDSAMKRKAEKSISESHDEEQKVENSNSQESEELPRRIEELKATKKETPVKKKVVVDHGKVLSLHNAGWTHRQIAEELGIAQSSVGTSLWKSRQAGKKVLSQEEIIADQAKRNRII